MYNDWLTNLIDNISSEIGFYLIIVVGLFFIIREITLWYYKINKITSLLESIDKSLSTLVKDKIGADLSTSKEQTSDMNVKEVL